MARWHAWATWIPVDDLLGAVPSHERGRAREVANDLKQDPYTVYRPGRGFKLDHTRIESFAELLRDECGREEFRIEATLSHFHGFDEG